jgi:hypothetical protein
MTLLIKQGRCYSRRDGKIAGPMAERFPGTSFNWFDQSNGNTYSKNGKWLVGGHHGLDLLTELEEPSSPESVEGWSVNEDGLTEAGLVAGEAYQVIGSLSHYANLFDHPEVQRALDWFSGFERGVTYKDDASILPWPKEELKPEVEIGAELATENAELAARVKVLEGALQMLCDRFDTFEGDPVLNPPGRIWALARSALAKNEG